jgi:hypothetical protein
MWKRVTDVLLFLGAEVAPHAVIGWIECRRVGALVRVPAHDMCPYAVLQGDHFRGERDVVDRPECLHI